MSASKPRGVSVSVWTDGVVKREIKKLEAEAED